MIKRKQGFHIDFFFFFFLSLVSNYIEVDIVFSFLEILLLITHLIGRDLEMRVGF